MPCIKFATSLDMGTTVKAIAQNFSFGLTISTSHGNQFKWQFLLSFFHTRLFRIKKGRHLKSATPMISSIKKTYFLMNL